MAYVVQGGDSLWRIAQSVLGDGNRWPEIAAANGITGTLIRPGQELQIPGQEADGGSAAPVPEGGPTEADRIRHAQAQDAGLLMADPVYRAWKENIGVREAEARNTVAAERDALNRQTQRSRPGYDEQRRQLAERIGNEWASRGLWRSGLRLRETELGRANITREQELFEAEQTERIRAEEAGLGRTLAGIQREGVTQEAAARQRAAQRQAEAEIRGRYPGVL